MNNLKDNQIKEAQKLTDALRTRINKPFDVVHFSHETTPQGKDSYRLSIEIKNRIYFTHAKNFNELVDKMSKEVKNPRNYPDAVSHQGDIINSILGSYYNR